jgi:hypothetical protein
LAIFSVVSDIADPLDHADDQFQKEYIVFDN